MRPARRSVNQGRYCGALHNWYWQRDRAASGLYHSESQTITSSHTWAAALLPCSTTVGKA
jgi:hypothetical protein